MQAKTKKTIEVIGRAQINTIHLSLNCGMPMLSAKNTISATAQTIEDERAGTKKALTFDGADFGFLVGDKRSFTVTP